MGTIIEVIYMPTIFLALSKKSSQLQTNTNNDIAELIQFPVCVSENTTVLARISFH